MARISKITSTVEFNVVNARQLALDKIDAVRKDLRQLDFGDVLESERSVTRGDQVFAVFGLHAVDVTGFELDGEFISKPVNIDARYFLKSPDEGPQGILSWCYFKEKDKWSLIWMRPQWIHTSELKLTAAEVAKNIANEIERGFTPLSG